MSNENGSSVGRSSAEGSAVGQTGSVGRATSVTGGAAKVFREFKWGLLTLFLLMVVVIGLVYDGGRKKKGLDSDKSKTADATPAVNLDVTGDAGAPPTAPVADNGGGAANAAPAAGANGSTAAAGTSSATTGAPGAATASSGAAAGLAAAPGAAVSANPPVSSLDSISPPPVPVSEAPATLPTSTSHKMSGERHAVTEKTLPPGSKASHPLHEKAAPPAEKPGNPVSLPGSELTYTVKPGDTLTKIANAKIPGKGNVKALIVANKKTLSNPNRLRPGMVLTIPSASRPAGEMVTNSIKAKTGPEDKAVKAEPEAKSENISSGEYVVQSGDTLERIARKLFNDGRKWRDIYEWNREQLSDPSRLRLGQALKIKPAKAGGTAAVPASSSARAEATPAEDPTEPKGVKRTAAAVVESEFRAPEVEVMSSSCSANMP